MIRGIPYHEFRRYHIAVPLSRLLSVNIEVSYSGQGCSHDCTPDELKPVNSSSMILWISYLCSGFSYSNLIGHAGRIDLVSRLSTGCVAAVYLYLQLNCNPLAYTSDIAGNCQSSITRHASLLFGYLRYALRSFQTWAGISLFDSAGSFSLSVHLIMAYLFGSVFTSQLADLISGPGLLMICFPMRWLYRVLAGSLLA
jgi:hypothetical protein